MSDLTFGEWMLIGIIFYIAWTISGVIKEKVIAWFDKKKGAVSTPKSCQATAWLNEKRGGGSDAQKNKKSHSFDFGDR